MGLLLLGLLVTAVPYCKRECIHPCERCKPAIVAGLSKIGGQLCGTILFGFEGLSFLPSQSLELTGSELCEGNPKAPQRNGRQEQEKKSIAQTLLFYFSLPLSQNFRHGGHDGRRAAFHGRKDCQLP